MPKRLGTTGIKTPHNQHSLGEGTLYKSQPWALAQDLLAGFFCEVDGDETIRMDEGELKYAEWVSRDAVELQPNDYSLTNEMMKMFKTGGVV